MIQGEIGESLIEDHIASSHVNLKLQQLNQASLVYFTLTYIQIERRWRSDFR